MKKTRGVLSIYACNMKLNNIKKILAKYEIGKIKSACSLVYMTESTNRNLFIIDSKKGKFVLKCIKNTNLILIKSEIFITSKLSGVLLPEGYLIKTKNGKNCVKYREMHCLLFKFLQGCSLNNKLIEGSLSKSDIESIALYLSKLHEELSNLKSKCFPFKESQEETIKRLTQKCLKFPKKESEVMIRQINKYNTLKNSGCIPSSVIHGDITPMNVLIDDDSVKVIDYGSVRLGSKIEDLTKILMSIWIQEDAEVDSNLNLFLKSYACNLNTNEIVLLLYSIKFQAIKNLVNGGINGPPQKDDRPGKFRVKNINNLCERFKDIVHTSKNDFLKKVGYYGLCAQ